jgi:phenylacetate-CoA ligase
MTERPVAEQRFWNEPMEAMPRDRMQRLQEEALPGRLEKAYRESPLYRELWDAHGVSAEDCTSVGDLSVLPLTVKDMVRDFRTKTGDPFGGLAGPVRPGSHITKSSGTSGAPTYFVTSPRDIAIAADEVASHLWAAGNRPGSVVMAGPGTGMRADAPTRRGYDLIQTVSVFTDASNMELFFAQVEEFKPEALTVVTGQLDRYAAWANEHGRDLQEMLSSVRRATFAGRHLVAPERARIAEALEVEDVFEIGGLGDIAMWVCDCEAHEGLHLRDDLFIVETIDPDTGEPMPEGATGELVFTSLWEESMNYVRWRTEDFGSWRRDPCSCGRTTTRFSVLGRVWERVAVGERTLLPGDFEAVLVGAFGRESFFQLVKSKETGQLSSMNVDVPQGLGRKDVERALADGLDITGVEVRVMPEAEIRAGMPSYKYRQVVWA